MLRRNSIVLVLGLFATVVIALAASKPKMKVSEDGFPSGRNTPEGAATDLARALLHSDVSLLQKTCLRPYGDGQIRSDYSAYITNLAVRLDQQKERAAKARANAGSITKVFAARHLSNKGPVSYGRATFDFQDVVFVDVEMELAGGKQHLRRTLVVKDQDGQWYVHPAPNLSPLLSDGLIDESPSEQLFSDVYTIER